MGRAIAVWQQRECRCGWATAGSSRPAGSRRELNAILTMEALVEAELERARTAPQEEIGALIHETRQEILHGLLENPLFQEQDLRLLLARRDLSSALLEKIAGREEWIRSYRVRCALAFHPSVPQALGFALVRQLYLSDLVRLTCSRSGHPALRRMAEERVLLRLRQLPVAQKITLARRGPARIQGALLMDGSQEILPTVLNNPLLNEGHVLQALSRIGLPAGIVAAIANHGRWSNVYAVRLALMRNPQTPLPRLLAILPTLSVTDLRILSTSTSAPAGFQPYIKRELSNRLRRGRYPVRAES